jgi:hypothetical protein
MGQKDETVSGELVSFRRIAGLGLWVEQFADGSA